MPSKPLRICAHPGCSELVRSTYCDKHSKAKAKEYDNNRESSTKRGYNSRWRKARLTYLSKNPICVRCEDKGITKLATDVDHIIPHKGNQTLFWDTNNWQALCHECHSRKTATEDGGFNNWYRG
jgi:5-methylcytosine-specific restriction protein A